MLKKIIKKIFRIGAALGSGVFWYSRDVLAYRKLLSKSSYSHPLFLFPKIFDKDPASHTFDKHYVYMDRWAFTRVLSARPSKHVDVGSSIRFLSMVTAITPTAFVDIRPIVLDFENFECIKGSVLTMPFEDNSVFSLSCLHVAEHIGLGRYGDPLDEAGTAKACKELQRVLAPGGSLYFALPIGKTATYFNAHRVHDPKLILQYFEGLTLRSFAAVNDAGHFIPQAHYTDFSSAHYACGMFEFTK